MVHNTGNVIAVDLAKHNQISGFYSSILKPTNPLRVRDWLVGRSLEEQFRFGVQVLRDFGVVR
jgi:hypothetical protein